MRGNYLNIKRGQFSAAMVRKVIWGCVVSAPILAFCYYMLWALNISRSTVLIKSLPAETIYLTLAGVLGVGFAWRAFCQRDSQPAGKKLKYVGEKFMFGAFIGFFLPLNSFDVWIYLFPDQTIRYITDYEITFPGPSRGKNSRCEAGIWIREKHTDRWRLLCSSKEEVRLDGKYRQRGMDGMWVTARINKLGAYVEHYEFGYKPLAEAKTR
ncbi:hypothetical protein [Erwinia sp. V71]|uniref:hypothetical protein n=1 Tax=Erwinia sp. V71 TaxID=3369424 RepID=UPI003F60B698